MTTAAERHLHAVPDVNPAPTTPVPLEGVVVPATKTPADARKSALSRAGKHAVANHGYLPWMVRGYGRYADAWMDRYRDDFPHMIQVARQALRDADVSEHKELKQTVRQHRRDYLKHRLAYVGATAGSAVGAGVGVAVAGGWWVDLALALGAWYAGVRKGRPEVDAPEPAAALTTTSVPAWGASPAPKAGSIVERDLVTALAMAEIVTDGQRADTRLVAPIRPDGPGWTTTIELPGGMEAAKAVAKADKLASALRVKRQQIELRADTSEAGHEGRVVLWVANDANPFAGPKVYSELINADQWRFWRDGIPLGTDARRARQTLNLIWSSILIGGLQDYGKSYLARLIAAAAALDPTVRIIVITGKTGPDWAPLKGIAHRWIAGSDPDTIREVIDLMTTTIGEMQQRGVDLDRLFEKEPHRVPEGKITPELAEDGMGPVLLIVEELQELLDGAALVKIVSPDDDSENPRKISARAPLIDLFARFNRLTRFVLGMGMYITQRPDADSVPTELREVCVKRACFRTKSPESSKMVLGEMAVKSGAAPHALLESSKGVFVLEEGAEDGYRTLRGDVIDLPDFVKICERGRQLRIAAGKLTGDAAAREERAQKVELDRLLITGCLRVMDDLGRDAAQLDELATAARLEPGRLADELRAAGVVRPDKVDLPGRGRVRGYDRTCLEEALERL